MLGGEFAFETVAGRPLAKTTPACSLGGTPGRGRADSGMPSESEGRGFVC